MSSVSRNTTYLTTALIIQKALSFILFSVLARPGNYGADGVGRYSFALAFTTVFAIFVDGGLTPVIIREVARRPGVSGNLLQRVIKVKGILFVITLAALMAVAYNTHAAREIFPLICIAAVVMAFDSLNLTLYGVLRGLHSLLPESFGIIAGQTLALLFGVVAIIEHLPLGVVIAGLCAGSILNTCIAYHALSKQLQFTDNAPPLMKLFKESSSFFLAGIFARGYSFLDSLLLGSWAGFVITGIYNVANKLTFAFQFIPLALTGALYPAFSALVARHDTEAAQTLWLKTERYLVVVGAFITAALVGLRIPILHFYGADFVRGEHVLIILALSLVFSFASYPTGALLNGSGLQHLQTATMGATLAINAIGNIFLIPRYGALGAAISACAGNVILFAGGVMCAHWRALKLPLKKFFMFALCVGILAALTAASMWYASTRAPWIFVGAVGAAVYGALLIIAGVVTREEARALYATMRG